MQKSQGFKEPNFHHLQIWNWVLLETIKPQFLHQDKIVSSYKDMVSAFRTILYVDQMKFMKENLIISEEVGTGIMMGIVDEMEKWMREVGVMVAFGEDD
ncbi:unnamed protein product [Lactuca saligna]|uniref:Uncharacterized protein n=1 Tax=Lactuca saligna TaxID=75948 RepID=A0AA35ZAT4_LACSI|nr:unnamed protein product [Lactuca saligna]